VEQISCSGPQTTFNKSLKDHLLNTLNENMYATVYSVHMAIFNTLFNICFQSGVAVWCIPSLCFCVCCLRVVPVCLGPLLSASCPLAVTRQSDPLQLLFSILALDWV
jgi:hypothetical protein